MTCAGELVISRARPSRSNCSGFLPGYVRCFVEKAAPLLDLRVDGDLEETFSLAPRGPGAADALLPALETYAQPARNRLTVYKPANREQVAWLHPGEPVFDSVSASILGRFGDHALRGAVFVDPCATEPYRVPPRRGDRQTEWSGERRQRARNDGKTAGVTSHRPAAVIRRHRGGVSRRALAAAARP